MRIPSRASFPADRGFALRPWNEVGSVVWQPGEGQSCVAGAVQKRADQHTGQ